MRNVKQTQVQIVYLTFAGKDTVSETENQPKIEEAAALAVTLLKRRKMFAKEAQKKLKMSKEKHKSNKTFNFWLCRLAPAQGDTVT